MLVIKLIGAGGVRGLGNYRGAALFSTLYSIALYFTCTTIKCWADPYKIYENINACCLLFGISELEFQKCFEIGLL